MRGRRSGLAVADGNARNDRVAKASPGCVLCSGQPPTSPARKPSSGKLVRSMFVDRRMTGSLFRGGRYYVGKRFVYLLAQRYQGESDRRKNKGLQSLFPTAGLAIQDGGHE